jgi:hypothetical protein
MDSKLLNKMFISNDIAEATLTFHSLLQEFAQNNI